MKIVLCIALAGSMHLPSCEVGFHESFQEAPGRADSTACLSATGGRCSFGLGFVYCLQELSLRGCCPFSLPERLLQL